MNTLRNCCLSFLAIMGSVMAYESASTDIAQLIEMRPGVCVYAIGAMTFEMPPRPNKSCALTVRVRQA